jgi:hypothetical protein
VLLDPGHVDEPCADRADSDLRRRPLEARLPPRGSASRRLEEVGVTGVFALPWRLYRVEHESIEARGDAVRRFGDEVTRRLDDGG